jgi:hypothetical protein
MIVGVRYRLALVLLAGMWSSAGCGEQHAPAATGALDGSARGNSSDAPNVDGQKPQGADGSDTTGASSTQAPTESKQKLAKDLATPKADSSRPPPGGVAKFPAAAAASRLPSGMAGGTSNITFDTIKFEMEKTQPFKPEMLTPAIRALDGKRIRIKGYILPSFQQSGIKQFVLVRDNMQCCFGPGAALYDCIVVDMAPGKTTEFKVTPVTVDGTFSMSDLLDPDGKHLAIYHLTGESVR